MQTPAPARVQVRGQRECVQASPAPPTDDNMGTYSVEAFAQRIQAIISDDCALMERLIRFGQTQKLAQKSNAVVETHRRQVGVEQLEQLAVEKLAIEERGVEQVQMLRQFIEGNAVLSAGARQPAQDAATIPDERRAVKLALEREEAQMLALLEEINLAQTENGNLRQQLRALGES
ncbi:hypothetical protein BJV74DRAFT_142008 [Russula compacta]|nr:hypothetical protein BJV74DRAFT_142008 [Russula compacta]